jgi:hypothetical protein
MEIPKDKVLELLQSRGDHDRAEQADKELPDKVDSEQHSDLLGKFGIEPSELLAMVGGGKIPGL